MRLRVVARCRRPVSAQHRCMPAACVIPAPRSLGQLPSRLPACLPTYLPCPALPCTVAMLDTAIEVKARLKSDDQSFKPLMGAAGAGGVRGRTPACRPRPCACLCLPRACLAPWAMLPAAGCLARRAAFLQSPPLTPPPPPRPRRQEPGHDLHQAVHAHPRVLRDGGWVGGRAHGAAADGCQAWLGCAWQGRDAGEGRSHRQRATVHRLHGCRAQRRRWQAVASRQHPPCAAIRHPPCCARPPNPPPPPPTTATTHHPPPTTATRRASLSWAATRCTWAPTTSSWASGSQPRTLRACWRGEAGARLSSQPCMPGASGCAVCGALSSCAAGAALAAARVMCCMGGRAV